MEISLLRKMQKSPKLIYYEYFNNSKNIENAYLINLYGLISKISSSILN